MIGIGAIGTYVPARRIMNRGRMTEFAVTEQFLAEKIGFEAVARKEPSEETSDLCVKAVRALKAEPAVAAAGGLGAIQCVFLCTQNPDGRGLPHTSAIVHEKLGLPAACACLDISLGCSGFVHALAVARAFMEANGMTSGLLLTADPYSKIIDEHDRNTAMIFGDGAAATWLTAIGPGAPLLTPSRARFHTEGHRHKALQNRDGVLHMDGRAVFNFSATAVPVEVNGLLAETGLGKDDVDLYLLHQGSRYIVDAIRTRLKLAEARVPVALTDCGNTVSSTIPMMLRRAVRDEAVRRVVICGFGVGLAVATCLLERTTSDGRKP
jgi:3-oxoacyl-[acyl-carrier-protein] synthase-3